MMVAAGRVVMPLRRRHIAEAVQRGGDAANIAARLRRRDDLLEEAAREVEVPLGFRGVRHVARRARSTAVTSPSCSHSETVSPKSDVASA